MHATAKVGGRPSSSHMPIMIRVNNKFDVNFRLGMTVQDVLDALNFTFRMIVVKVDGVVVLQPDWDATEVPDGAEMQALHLISGG
jgi:sulfur carrier protein